MSNKQHEEQLKKWVEQAYYDVEIPDGEQSWKEVRSRLNKMHKKKQWSKRIKLSALVACSYLLLSFTINTDLSTAYSRFSGLLTQVQENIVDIFFNASPEPEPHVDSNPNANTLPPPDLANPEGGVAEGEFVSWEVAKEKAFFPLMTPSYIPEKYELNVVNIIPDSEGNYRAVLAEFANPDGLIIQLNQRSLREGSSTEKLRIQHREAEIKNIMLEGNEAILIKSGDNLIQLEWLTLDDIKFSLMGKGVTEEDIIKMANSLHE